MRTGRKVLSIAALLAALAVLPGCRTTEHVAYGTERVAEKTAHGAGHVVHKVGTGLAHVGEKIEEHTD